jgi:hypothetical protein
MNVFYIFVMLGFSALMLPGDNIIAVRLKAEL